MFKQKKIYLGMLLGAGALALTACSGGTHSSDEPNPFAGVETDIIVEPTTTLLTGQSGILEFEVINTSVSTMQIGAASGASSVTVANILSRADIIGDATVSIVQTNNIGPGRTCWNAQEGATLAPSESCVQYVAINSTFKEKEGEDNNAEVTGNIDVVLTTQGQSKILPVPLNVSFKPEINFEDTAQIEATMPSKVFPHSELAISVSNLGVADANGFYIDLSEMKDRFGDFYAGIDWSTLKGAVPYPDAENPERLYIPEIQAGESVDVSFVIGDIPEDEKDDLSEEILGLKTGGGNTDVAGDIPKPEVLTSLDVISESFKNRTYGIEGGYVPFANPSTSATPLKEIQVDSDQSNIPEGVTVSVDCPEALAPGQQCAIQINVSSEAGEKAEGRFLQGHYTVTYKDDDGNNYKVEVPFNIDITTRLAVTESSPVLLRPYVSGDQRETTVTIKNNGGFNFKLPENIGDIFSISGQNQQGLSVEMVSCSANQVIEPNQECTIKLISTDRNDPLGLYQLNTEAVGNLKPELLTSFELQATQASVDSIVFENLPPVVSVGSESQLMQLSQNDATERGFARYAVKFTNTSGQVLEIERIQVPEGDNFEFNFNAANTCVVGSSIPARESCILSYDVFGDVGARVRGDVKVDFKPVDADIIEWKRALSSQFVLSSALPSNAIEVTSDVRFALGQSVTIAVENNQPYPLQNVTLDLSGIDQAVIDQIQDFVGGVWNADEKTLTMESPLGAGNRHTFGFKLEDTASDALKDAASQLSNNPVTKQLSIISSSSQPLYPVVSVLTSPLVFNVSDFDDLTLGSNYIEIENESEEPIDVSLENPSELPTGVSVDIPSPIPSGSGALLDIHLAPEISVSGDHEFDIKVCQDGECSVQTISYHIPPVSIVNGNTSQPADLYRALDDQAGEPLRLVLRNSGDFTLSPLLSTPTDVFKVVDVNGNAVSEQFALSSTCAGILPQRLCSLTLSLLDEQTPIGVYEIHTKQAANLTASKIMSINVLKSFAGFSFKLKEELPQQILANTKVYFEAEITNNAGVAYQFKGIDLPSGATVVFDDSTPAAGGNCWDGEQGASLEDGQKCTLRFSIEATEGDAFVGPMSFEVESDEGTEPQTIEDVYTFDSTFAEEVSSLTVLNGGDNPLTFITDGVASFDIRVDTTLNNPMLLLSDLPKAVYDQIEAITLDGRALNKLEPQADLPLGPNIRPGEHSIKLQFSADAGDALKQNFDALIVNPQNQLFGIKASNQTAIYPDINVEVTPFSAPNKVIANAGSSTLTITNNTNHIFTVGGITIVNDGNTPLENVEINTEACQSSVPALGSCDITVVAANNAKGKARLQMNYTSSLSPDYTLSTDISVLPVQPSIAAAVVIVAKKAEDGPNVVTNVPLTVMNDSEGGQFKWQLPGGLGIFTLDRNQAADPIRNGLRIVEPVSLGDGKVSCSIANELPINGVCYVGIESSDAEGEQTAYRITTSADALLDSNVKDNQLIGQFALGARGNLLINHDASWGYPALQRFSVTNNATGVVNDLEVDLSGSHFMVYDGQNGGAWCSAGICPDACDLDEGGNLVAGQTCYIYTYSTSTLNVGEEATGVIEIKGNINQSRYFNLSATAYLYAGGFFNAMYETPNTAYLARWDGSQWSAVGTNTLDDEVYALATDTRGTLYAGGSFAGYIKRWDGRNWQTLNSADGSAPSIDAKVTSLAISPDNQALYAGGAFNHKLLQWNGVDWSQLGSVSLDGQVLSIYSFVNNDTTELLLGGTFTDYFKAITVTGAPTVLGSANPTNGPVNAITQQGDCFYIGGNFDKIDDDTVDANAMAYICPNDPVDIWQPVGDGTASANAKVYALAAVPNSVDVLVGGYFSTLGGEDASGTAVVNTAGEVSGLANLNGPAYALLSYGGVEFIAGDFKDVDGQTIWNIAYSNDGGDTWQPLGGGANSYVGTLAVGTEMTVDDSLSLINAHK